MSFTDKLKSKIQEIKASTLVAPEVAEQRIEICRKCPELMEKAMLCQKCGCFMPGKTKLVVATCPLGKW